VRESVRGIRARIGVISESVCEAAVLFVSDSEVAFYSRTVAGDVWETA